MKFRPPALALRAIVCPALALLLANDAAAQIDRLTGRAFATRSEVIAPHGMVCTSHPLATQIGLDVLKQGGSAVDAALAANIALGLMEPINCGPSGDLFAIVWEAKTKKLHGLNASGRSPLGLSLEQIKAEVAKLGRDKIPMNGMLCISVPGAIDGWFELHGRFGKLPMADLFAPTIRYAEEGFPVTDFIAYMWDVDFRTQQAAPTPGAYREVYAPKGRAPLKGEMFKNPDLARSYRLLAQQGRDAFYRGEMADRMDAYFAANGGWLRKRDFEQHTSTWVDPVSVNYRGYDVYELPPNSQGMSALQMLNLLEGFDLKRMGFNSPETLHVMIEAKKVAFEDRAKFYTDPAFAKIPIAGLLSKPYAAERRKLINLERASKTLEAGHPAMNQGDTIYLCAADKDGNMVSLIQSNFFGTGSGAVTPGLGFGFQNRGALFALQEGHANVYAPGKRPFQTIIPGFVMKDGEPWEAFGLMGGVMQPQGHVQVLINQIDFGMNLQEAGDAARWKHEGSSEVTGEKMKDGGYVQVESGVPYESVRALVQRGHDVRARSPTDTFGGYQAIRWDKVNRVYIGASESRKDGQAAGY
ncbi:MAG TPA: gamma-glutamyltransferase [Opitutaceae bacterium]|nr:gamma-glutamyltransferase [Opitutaceae bacterium]